MTRYPAAVVFDLDGTIVGTEQPCFEAWRRTWADHGHEDPITAGLDLTAADLLVDDLHVDPCRRLGRDHRAAGAAG